MESQNSNEITTKDLDEFIIQDGNLNRFLARIHLSFGWPEDFLLDSFIEDDSIAEALQLIKDLIDTTTEKSFDFNQYYYPTSVEVLEVKAIKRVTTLTDTDWK